jgi:hypothetical protein
MKRTKLGLAVLATALAANASAQQFYAGAGMGWTNPQDSEFDTSYGIKLTGGYEIMENLAVELSYLDLGEFEAGAGTLAVAPDDFDLAFGDVATTVDINSASLDVAGFDASVVGKMQLPYNLEGFARLGVFAWDADLDVDVVTDGEGNSIPGSDDGFDLSYGLGVGYEIDQFWSVTGEWTNFRVMDGDITYLGVSGQFRF